MSQALHVILLGAPGSGKGTQGKLIEKHFGVIHFAAGDILRREVAKKTELGLQAKAIMDRGELLADDLITAVMERRLTEGDCVQGWVLDGFPRTIGQAEAFDRILEKRHQSLHFAFMLDIPDDEIVSRLVGRIVCMSCGAGYHRLKIPPKKDGRCDVCGEVLVSRADDVEETIRARLKVYKQQTAPLVDYYARQGMLKRILGEGPIEKVFERIKRNCS